MSTFPDDNLIRTNVACVNCGYNLRTLSFHNVCPECRTPVINSVSRHMRFPSHMRRPVAEALTIVGASFILTAFLLLWALIGGVPSGQATFLLVVLALGAEQAVRLIGILRITNYVVVAVISRDNPVRLRSAAIGESAIAAVVIGVLLLEFCGIDPDGYGFSVAALALAVQLFCRGLVVLYAIRLLVDLDRAIDHPSLIGNIFGRISRLLGLFWGVILIVLPFILAAQIAINELYVGAVAGSDPTGLLFNTGCIAAALFTWVAIVFFWSAICLHRSTPDLGAH